MILLLILILWLISLSLRITSSGVDALHKINDRLVDKKVEDVKSKKSIKKVTKVTKKVSNTAFRLARRVVDTLRHLLSLLLPLVMVLDIIVFILIASAGGFLLLFEENSGSNLSSSYSQSEGVTDTGKSKILLIGDSRTVQLGMTVFNMSSSNDSDGLPKVIGSTSSGDYLYSKGSMGLNWMKQEESNIDKQVDSSTSVVVNMGTNDCYSSSSANNYITYLNDKAKDWESSGADVYFVSTNPINDSLASSNGYSVRDSHVTKFNSDVKKGLDSSIKYIDTYSEVKSLVIDRRETGDGIHYNKAVYEKIKEVIWNTAKSSNSGDLKSNFKAINQNPELPTGCEVTSLTMTLNYLGVNADKSDIADNYIDKGPIGSTDFNKKFVGDPRDVNSYGCYAPVIVNAANKYLTAKGSSLNATNISGKDLEELFTSYIDKNIPVIVWGTVDNREGRYTTTWKVDGQDLKWYSPEHCMVLVGYDNDKVWVADPMHGDVRSYKKSTFKDRYNSLKKQAVVIQ